MSKKAFISQDGEETTATPTPRRDLGMDQVQIAVKGIRYGEVRVIIQDGVIVQIERVEKQRIR
jgi:hypothetical protein